MSKKIRVMVVDDSALVRQTMTEILESDPGIEVIASAVDPFMAVLKMKTETPDVITLDVEMPRMDGITFLRKLMTQHPIPVIMVSTLTSKSSETAMKAMEYGAVEIIEKPKVGTKKFLKEAQIRLCDSVKSASKVNVSKLLSTLSMVPPKLNADVMIVKPNTNAMLQTTEKIIIIGASTGGTEAIRIVLESLPIDCPGILIVQHMPEHFTASFAERLNGLCKISVKEAKNGDSVLRGLALIAPGNAHMLLKRSGAKYYVNVKQGPLVCRHRPSVDVLFRSAARSAGKNAIGIIMTGMGDDGANGLLEMKQSGAETIAQDEKTCVVFGMPKEAISAGAVDKILPLMQIPGTALRMAL